MMEETDEEKEKLKQKYIKYIFVFLDHFPSKKE